MIRSIFVRVLLSHIAVILVASLTLGSAILWVVHQQGVETKRNDLLQRATAVANYLAPSLSAGQFPDSDSLDKLDDMVGATAWIIDERRTIIAGDAPNYWRRQSASVERISELLAGNPQSWVYTSRDLSERAVIAAVPVRLGNRPAAIFLRYPYSTLENATEKMFRLFLFPLVISIFAAFVLGWFIARSVTRPMAEIGRTAQKFAAGDYSVRFRSTANDEVAALGRNFNQMAESIAQAESNRRDFLANVSHELKTPVASIRAMTEALLDRVIDTPEDRRRYLERILASCRRMGYLVDDLLDLARMEAGEMKVTRERITLHNLIHSTIEKFTEIADAKNVSLRQEISPASLFVTADPNRLGQILDNYLSNALRHSPESAQIIISAGLHGDTVTISVTDQGEGIADADLPYIWDRFYRAEKSRSRSLGGTGLGLAICMRLAKLMGGSVQAENMPTGGARFSISLPQA